MTPSARESEETELRPRLAALVRQGRYQTALEALRKNPPTTDDLRVDLAEVLVWVGRAEDAEGLVASVLRRTSGSTGLGARCHAVRGIIERDRGRLSDARESFLRAIRQADECHDKSVAAWAALRLILAVAEESGPQAAGGIVGSVRKRLNQLGDAQAIAAFHLFLGEIESKRGLFDSARRHLRTGRSLLGGEPNDWLSGYAHIAEACVAYLESDIQGAANAALDALGAGRDSGHRMTSVAAMATLAQVLLSRGDLAQAESQLQDALLLCPHGGGAETGILDTLAQIRLATGDLTGCSEALEDIARRAPSLDPQSFYNLCAALTEVRLALATGRGKQALELATHAYQSALERSFSTLTTSLRLLQAEALVRTRHHARAAVVVAEAAGQAGPAPMDTLAEVNRVAAVALAAAGDLAGAGAAFERAARILATVGNRTARADLLEQYAEAIWPVVRQGSVPFPGRTRRDQLPPPPASVAVRLDAVTRLVPAPCAAASHTAIRAATIVDAGGYPEVLAHEVAGLLLDTGAALAGALTCRPGDAPTEIHAWWGCSWREARALAASPPRRIDFGNWHGRHFEIALRPADGMEAALSLVAAEKLARGARWQDQARRDERERSALWPVEPGGDSDDAIFLSQGMTDLVTSVRRVAPLDVLVLLTGETGTGKEMIARGDPRRLRPRQPTLRTLQLHRRPARDDRQPVVRLPPRRLHGRRSPTSPASSAPPPGAPSSSTRSASWDPTSSRSCCGSSSRARSSRSATPAPRGSRSASSPPPTPTSSASSPRAASAKTSTTGSRSSGSPSRRCASGARRSRRWRSTSSSAPRATSRRSRSASPTSRSST